MGLKQTEDFIQLPYEQAKMILRAFFVKIFQGWEFAH